jgi:hypothetical protein
VGGNKGIKRGGGQDHSGHKVRAFDIGRGGHASIRTSWHQQSISRTMEGC